MLDGSKWVKAESGTCAAVGGTDIDVFERVGALLKLRRHFHHHMILIERRYMVETCRWPKAS